ncbi:MAG: NAD(+) synthase [Cytophagales bacterium]|nr:NAD(+) synthase [Cytophagales bacterium]
MSTYKIAGASLNQTPIDWANNMQNILHAIEEAQKNKVDLLCLPELCITGYGCEDLFLHDWVTEKALYYLEKIVAKSNNITLFVGLPIRWGDQCYNCTCVIKDKAIQGFTPKQFLAHDGVHYEPRWFTSWQGEKVAQICINHINYPLGDIIYEIEALKIGIEICEDAWHAHERPAHRLKARGVNIIVNPSASHFAFGKSAFREHLVVSSSKQFDGVYLYTNLLGNEAGKLVYEGETFIAQKGRLLAKNAPLSFQNFEMVSTEINIERPTLSKTNIQENDQSNQEAFTQALSLALFDYLRKSKNKGFVISLSGGADSSTCAVLVATMIKRSIEALGFDNFVKKLGVEALTKTPPPSSHANEVLLKQLTHQLLTCVYQKSENSSTKTLEAAKALAHSIGAAFFQWEVDDVIKSYTKKMQTTLQQHLSWEADDGALQNIQARARVPGIWMLANLKHALLLTTSNRSEGDVGYATMDGDMAGSLAPLAGVDKFFLLHWLKWAEKALGYQGLHLVNQLQPSAELRPPTQQQTDEGDVMPYSVLLKIERLAIKEGASPKKVFESLCNYYRDSLPRLVYYIEIFYRRWASNQWKRERMAPSFHVDDFSIDPRAWYRFPILSGAFEEEIKEMKAKLNGVRCD